MKSPSTVTFLFMSKPSTSCIKKSYPFQLEAIENTTFKTKIIKASIKISCREFPRFLFESISLKIVYISTASAIIPMKEKTLKILNFYTEENSALKASKLNILVKSIVLNL